MRSSHGDGRGRRLLRAGTLSPIRLAAVAALALVLLGALPGPAGAGAAATPAQSLSALELGTITEINRIRASYGVAPLAFSAQLFQAATAHSRDMVADGYFSHQTNGGRSFLRRLEYFYPVGSSTNYEIGENLYWANGPIDGARIVDRWMTSPAHRSNLLAPGWTQVGVSAITVPSAPGVYDGLEVTVVTVDFGVRT